MAEPEPRPNLYQADPFLSDEAYEYIFSRSVRSTVDLVICHQEGIILARRNIEPNLGQWCLPGGRRRYKVPVSDTAAWIADSELGVTIGLGELIGYLDYMDDGRYVHSQSLVFLARILDGNPRAKDQASDLGFFQELPENTHPLQEAFLRSRWDQIIQFAAQN